MKRLLCSLACSGTLLCATGIAAAGDVGLDEIYFTGTHQSLFFNGTLTNLGWSSGDLGAGLTERWLAQPFVVPEPPPGSGATEWYILQLQPYGFTPAGVTNEQLRFTVWSRNGQDAPQDGDQITSGSIPFPTPFTDPDSPSANDVHPIDTFFTLPPGEYYLTVYAETPGTTSNFAWFTNAQNAIDFVDEIGPWNWRSGTFPSPGFQFNQLLPPTLEPDPDQPNPDATHSAAFRILGLPAVGAECTGDLNDSGEVDGADLALLLGAWGECGDPKDCPADLDGSGSVDGADLALLLGNWGDCPEAPALDGACCLPDGSCVVTTADVCGNDGGVFQGLGTTCDDVDCPQPPSTCCSVEAGQVGCDDPTCEDAVCAELAFCCSFEWDAECASLANEICDVCIEPPPCEVDCPDGALDEGEACGADTNGGCNASPPTFGSITCGDTICGTGWADGGSRDTDWFSVSVDVTTDVSADLVSQFPGVTFFLEITDPCTAAVIGAFGHSDEDCSVGTATATLEPGGTYALFVGAGNEDGSGVFEGFPCDSANAYTVTLTCE